MPEPLPVDQLADPHVLLGILGSFWSRTYGGRDQALAIAGAAGDAGAQAQLDLFELVESLARRTVPIAHRERWRVLYLLRSQRSPAVPTFGAAGAFGGGLSFGDVLDPGPYSWPCPIDGVATIFNRLSSPSRSLTCGVDFSIGGGAITFRDDPFDDPLLAARDVMAEDGTAADREVALWCFAADTDLGYVYEQFGYVLGLKLPSSEAYRDLVNAILDAFVGGTAVDQLLAALAAITGTPLALEPSEVVRYVLRDARGLVVATDLHAYRFPGGATPVVAPGDVVNAGDPMVDTIEVRDLNDGLVPPGLLSLATGAGILAPGYYADLVWPGRDVALEVEEGPGQFTKVRWELGGYPQDVDKFWDEVHERGIVRGETLAHLLDVRDSPSTEPTRDSLPATINPLGFLVGNLLRGNAVFVRIRAGGLGRDALGLEQLRLLRRIVPPHACLITLIDLPPLDDSVNMGAIVEELADFDVGAPFSEYVPRTSLQDGPSEVAFSDPCR